MRVSLSTWFLTALLLLVAAIAAATAIVWMGLYNVAADDPHSRAMYRLLETLRERSIDTRVADLQLPDLSDPDGIRQGAGNYDAMCVSCHLAPGLSETELRSGLYPQPPDLTTNAVDPAAAFWVIKHGIKGSGMPAWGKSMADTYIWNLTAFVLRLPGMTEAEYRELVATSGGHSHGEVAPIPALGLPHSGTADPPAGKTHRHADGTVESH